VDEARHHSARPSAGIHVAVFHDAGINAAHFADDVLEFYLRAQLLFLFEEPLNGCIL
jgi:hypothetical protein